PGQTLATLARQTIGDDAAPLIVSSLARGRNESQAIFAVAGALWASGSTLHLDVLSDPGIPNCPLLPTYPFEPKDFGLPVEPSRELSMAAPRDSGSDLPPVAELNGGSREPIVWRRDLANSEPLISDHTVLGRFIMPGVCWLE